MGAGGKFPYPKEVWSPAGGWWPYPKNWRVNTAMAFVLLFGLSVPVFIASERKMVHYEKPDRPIPWRRYLGSKQEDEAAAAAKAAE